LSKSNIAQRINQRLLNEDEIFCQPPNWHLPSDALNYCMMTEHSKDSPDVIAFPPAVFLTALGVGMFLNWLVPMGSFASESFRVMGAIVAALGTSVCAWGYYTLRRASTNVRPDRPATTLVTSGPFRYSRNPLYVSVTVIYLGIALTVGSIWLLITLIPALVITHWRIVLREEKYLEARFGDNYRAYKTRVHRWL
jgi:protein-S-isoprenylcysteine O-methyltransferase Ste14